MQANATTSCQLYAVDWIYATPLAAQHSEEIFGVLTKQTDQGVQIMITNEAGELSLLSDVQPVYVQQVVQFGPLVLVSAYAPGVTLTPEQAKQFMLSTNSFDPEHHCYLLAATELPKHPALAALLTPPSPPAAPVALPVKRARKRTA